MEIKISIGPIADTHASQQTIFSLYPIAFGKDLKEKLSWITKHHSYSAIEFIDNIRKGNNFLQSQLIILDFDEGMTIAQALETFKNVFGMIVTTKSHQQTTKGGLADGKPIEKRDRFRVILFLEKPITDPVEFVTVMTNAINTFGSDKACKDLARYYFPNPTQEVWFMEEAKGYIDITPYLTPIETTNKTAKKQVTSVDKNVSQPAMQKTGTIYTPLTADMIIVGADGEELTAKQWYEKLEVNENVTVHCPYPEHEDNNPSAFISKKETKSLFASCNSCGKKGFYNINGNMGKVSSKKASIDQLDISINQFSNAVIQKLKTVGEFKIDEIIEQFLSCGIPLSSLSGRIYLWIDGYWQRHEDLEIECYIFVKKSIHKIKGSRPSKNEIKQVCGELGTELREFKKMDGIAINFNDQVLTLSYSQKNIIHKLVPHSEEFEFRYKLPFDHLYKASCPTIDKFMLESIGDIDTINFFYEFLATCFFKNDVIKIEMALFLLGSGSNGKSLLLSLVENLFGSMNISHISLDDINDETKRVAAVGKLFNIASEGSQKSVLTSDFKTMASKEPLSTRLLYQNSHMTDDFPRLIFATNNLPNTGGDHTRGLYRKVSIIPFENNIPYEKQDKQLLSKLLPELSGMMIHVLNALYRVYERRDLRIPEKVKKANNSFEYMTNPVKYFIDSEGYVIGDSDIPIYNVKTLYSDFCEFCRSNGITPIMSNRAFSSDMSAKFGKQVHSNKLYGWRIIKSN